MTFDEHELMGLIPRLRRYARALTGDRTRADDLVQDTLERGSAKLSLWRPETDLRAWLFTIMHNCFINQLRRGRGAVLLALDDVDEPATTQNAPDEGLVVHDLLAAVARLKPEHREVLLLVAIEQLRYEEVAKVLAIPIGTVMSRLSRAREQLRAALDAEAAPVVRRIK